MSKIKTLNADIFTCKENILVHQVNCCGVMGGGLAKQIKARHPDVFQAYRKFITNQETGCSKSSSELLGLICYAKPNNATYTVANCFGQDGYGVSTVQTNYDAVRDYMLNLKRTGMSIAIPYKIGCGLGGGDWKIVNGIIMDTFSSYINDVTIYKI